MNGWLPIVLLALSSCGAVEIVERSAEWPVEKVKRVNETCYVFLARGVDKSRVVNLEVFGESFRPRMSFEDARAIGLVHLEEYADGQDQVRRYQSSLGTIEIVKAHVSNDGRDWVQWQLRAIPSHNRVEEVLGAAVVASVPEILECSVVALVFPDGEGRVELRLESGQVEEIAYQRQVS